MSWSRRACANPGRRFGTTIPTKLEDAIAAVDDEIAWTAPGPKRDALKARFEELEARRRRGEKTP